MGPLRPFLLVCGPGEVVVYYWAMLPCNCIGCILGRASRTKETAQFSLNLRSRKKGTQLCGVGLPDIHESFAG